MTFPFHSITRRLALALGLALAFSTLAQANPSRRLDALRRVGDDDSGGEVAPASTPAPKTVAKDDRVAVMGSTSVGPDEKVEGNAVAVMGNLSVEGEVQHDAVAVMGDNHVDGTVHGEVVAVLGNVYLGPHAVVDRDVTCVVGQIFRDPGAKVHGSIVHQVGEGALPRHLISGMSAWWNNGLSSGRLLPWVHETRPLWFLMVALVLLCALMAATFPRAVRSCGDTLVHRPGATVFTGLLSILALPFLFILLLVTVVGIPVALVLLPLGLFGATLFGSAALMDLIGRGLLRGKVPAAVGVIVAGAIIIALYAMPVIGVPVHFLVSFLGFSCAMAGLFGLKRATVSVAASSTPSPQGIPPVQGERTVEVTFHVGSEPEATAAPEPVAPPVEKAVAPASVAAAPGPVLPPGSLPRAGFWIRMAALAIDAILVGVIVSPIGGGHLYLLFLAAYGALLWKTKGSTVGGIIFKLRVIRADDRPVDWPTAIVRALGCFISLVIGGLGFVWIAFDLEKQAWHDKISGTIVVREAKSTPLV